MEGHALIWYHQAEATCQWEVSVHEETRRELLGSAATDSSYLKWGADTTDLLEEICIKVEVNNI